MLRHFIATLACLLAAAAWPQVGGAAPVKGSLQLAPDFVAKPLFDAPGYWRGLTNEILDVLPPHGDPRMEMFVTVEGRNVSPAGAIAAALVIEDYRFLPVALAVPPRSKVTFENRDSTQHLLETAGSEVMPARRVDAGATTSFAFPKPGLYTVRCSEYPHMRAEVLVTDSALAAVPDATGTFRFNDVPSGTHTLRVWYRGQVIHSQQLTVRGRTAVDVMVGGPQREKTGAP